MSEPVASAMATACDRSGAPVAVATGIAGRPAEPREKPVGTVAIAVVVAAAARVRTFSSSVDASR